MKVGYHRGCRVRYIYLSKGLHRGESARFISCTGDQLQKGSIFISSAKTLDEIFDKHLSPTTVLRDLFKYSIVPWKRNRTQAVTSHDGALAERSPQIG